METNGFIKTLNFYFLWKKNVYSFYLFFLLFVVKLLYKFHHNDFFLLLMERFTELCTDKESVISLPDLQSDLFVNWCITKLDTISQTEPSINLTESMQFPHGWNWSCIYYDSSLKIQEPFITDFMFKKITNEKAGQKTSNRKWNAFRVGTNMHFSCLKNKRELLLRKACQLLCWNYYINMIL